MKENLRKLCCPCNISSGVLKLVEQLQAQMLEITNLSIESIRSKTQFENELKEATDKVFIFRGLIQELESQIEIQEKEELNLRNVASQLQEKIKDQVKYNEEITAELQSLKSEKDNNELNQKIFKLEEELSRFQVSAELGSDETSRQFKTQLEEMELILEKRTKDLESLQCSNSSTNCPSPSEDVSLRDHISNLSSASSTAADLSLQQLARFKDKLLRHQTVEEAAIKRIKDLETQLLATKQDYEAIQREKDVLQDQLSQQMHDISSLQVRLDQRRLRVESVQKKTNVTLPETKLATKQDYEAIPREKEVLQDQLSQQVHDISSI